MFSPRLHHRSERGQASVELVATLPAVVLVTLIVWQLALAGQTAWLCANAARVAARAAAVGEDAEAAARSSLPASLERDLDVARRNDGTVEVEVRVPILVRAWKSPLSIRARAGLQEAER
jgi:pilus assembly protein CpaE